MILTIFFDSDCPLCKAEIKQLKIFDTNNQLCFEDIHADDFNLRYPFIDKIAANKILHGQLANGEIIYGLDVTCMAWTSVGKHRWLAVLRWPVIRWISDRVYIFFARHRNKISALLMNKKDIPLKGKCKSCSTR